MNSHPIVRAQQQAGRDIGAWCALTIRQYRLLSVLFGAIYCAFILALIAMLATPY